MSETIDHQLKACTQAELRAIEAHERGRQARPVILDRITALTENEPWPGYDLETTDQIALKSLLFGLPCMTAGLLIGSLIAQVTVGASYFRDPKILLAFAMWLVYIGMIHIRRIAGLRGRRAVYLSSFVFFIVLAVWAANQFSSVHRFTAP